MVVYPIYTILLVLSVVTHLLALEVNNNLQLVLSGLIIPILPNRALSQMIIYANARISQIGYSEGIP